MLVSCHHQTVANELRKPLAIAIDSLSYVGMSKKSAMHWWRSQLISRFPSRKIEMYPFLSVQRAVSGQV